MLSLMPSKSEQEWRCGNWKGYWSRIKVKLQCRKSKSEAALILMRAIFINNRPGFVFVSPLKQPLLSSHLLHQQAEPCYHWCQAIQLQTRVTSQICSTPPSIHSIKPNQVDIYYTHSLNTFNKVKFYRMLSTLAVVFSTYTCTSLLMPRAQHFNWLDSMACI